MLMSFALLTLVSNTTPDVEFIDSRSNDEMTYVVVDGSCPVMVKKVDLKNIDKILKQVDEVCGLDLQFNERDK